MKRSSNARLLWIGASALLVGCFGPVDERPDAGPPGTPRKERTCGETGKTIEYTPWDWPFEGCTVLAGNLYVSPPGDTKDLLPLRGIHTVHGTLTVYFSVAVKALTGLEDLEDVGALQLTSNLELVDLAALSSLRSASKVEISTNPKLETLDGLSGLTTIDELVITGNVSLRSLAGLSNLSHIRGGLYISGGNSSLPTSEVAAFLQRVQVDGEISIH